MPICPVLAICSLTSSILRTRFLTCPEIIGKPSSAASGVIPSRRFVPSFQQICFSLMSATMSFATTTSWKTCERRTQGQCDVELSSVSLAPLDSPATPVILVIGPIPEHCTFSSTFYDIRCLFQHHTLTCTLMSLMYIGLLVHYIEQSTFFIFSAVLPHPTSSFQLLAISVGTSLAPVLKLCFQAVFFSSPRFARWGSLV
jgi:hypothetical protein